MASNDQSNGDFWPNVPEFMVMGRKPWQVIVFEPKLYKSDLGGYKNLVELQELLIPNENQNVWHIGPFKGDKKSQLRNGDMLRTFSRIMERKLYQNTCNL